MSYDKDAIARHHGYSDTVKEAWERASDSLAKIAAGWHLERANTAALTGNEVEFLLETHRAERVLLDHDCIDAFNL